jgi:hypothetical protein
LDPLYTLCTSIPHHQAAKDVNGKVAMQLDRLKELKLIKV